MKEKKFCMKSRAELDEIRKQQASKKASVNESSDTERILATKKLNIKRLEDNQIEITSRNNLGGQNIYDMLLGLGIEDEKVVKILPSSVIISESKIRKASKKASVNESSDGWEQYEPGYFPRTGNSIMAQFDTDSDWKKIQAIIFQNKGNGLKFGYEVTLQTASYGTEDSRTGESDYANEIVSLCVESIIDMGNDLGLNLGDVEPSVEDIKYLQSGMSESKIRKSSKKASVNEEFVKLKDGREGHIGGKIFDKDNKWTGKYEFYTDENDYEYEEITDADIVDESKINEISDETVYNAVAKAHSVARDGKTIQRAVRMHNKGLNREFAKNGLPNPKTLENPLTDDENRAKEYARVNKEYSDKIASRMKSESVVNEISDELAQKVANRRQSDYKKAKELLNKAVDKSVEKHKGFLNIPQEEYDKDIHPKYKDLENKANKLRRNRMLAKSESLTASKALAMSKAILDETWATSGSGYVELDIPKQVWNAITTTGENDIAVEKGLKNPEIAKQFAEYDDATIDKAFNDLSIDITPEEEQALTRHEKEAYILWSLSWDISDNVYADDEMGESKINEISDETVNNAVEKRVKNALAKNYNDEEANAKELRITQGAIRRKARKGGKLTSQEKEYLKRKNLFGESKINEEDVAWHEKTFDGTKEGVKLTPEQAKQLENMMFKVYNIINAIENLDDNELGNLAGIQSQQGFDITGHDLIDFFKVELGLDIE